MIQLVMFYELNILTRYMSARYLVFKPKKAQLNLIFFPSKSYSVSHISLLLKGANLIICLIETSLGTVRFLIRIKRGTLRHMQPVLVKDQISKTIFQ